MIALKISDLAAVVYSSGKVFDGLRTGRLDTESFLRSGDTSGVASRIDLALLEDMRDVARLILSDPDRAIDADFVKAVNATMTRSASIFPGELRTDEQKIGVATRYGEHMPAALDEKGLEDLVASATKASDPADRALDLFVALAKAQPFTDGNKRTALFVANAELIASRDNRLLTIPVDEKDPSVADRFNDLLARSYVFDEDEEVKTMLQEKGFVLSPASDLSGPKQAFDQRLATIEELGANADDSTPAITVTTGDGNHQSMTERQYWSMVEDHHSKISAIAGQEIADGKSPDAFQTFDEGTAIIDEQIKAGRQAQKEHGLNL